ncbi:hypothetical protein SLE2022_122290 [Rubroshorea leprosula]
MGCATSKLQELPAVALCRDRCNFLEEALRQSYALADAHVAYMKSLESLGPALCLFFEQIVDSSLDGDSSRTTEKSLKPDSQAFSPDPSPSSSNSDSHIRFDFSSEEEDGDGGFESSNYIQSNYLDHSTLTLNSSRNHNYGTNADQAFDYFSRNNEFHGSGSKTPPPPPSRSTAWDYLNFFDESYERYELPYSANEAVEDKGDSNLNGEFVKKIPADKDFGKNFASGVDAKEIPSQKTAPVEKKKKEKEEKKKERIKERSESDESKNQRGEQTVYEVMRELQVLFQKASDSGNEVLKMLDTGRFRYHDKKSVYQGSSKTLNMMALNLPVKGSLSSADQKNGTAEEHWTVNSENLSSTLKKLCMWEKKLYNEVKDEEKLRIIHERKSRQVRSLDERGTDARKVDSIRTLIRTLSTKMTVAVQVIDRISITINKLMDEELWPHICELIQRLLEMWKEMLECHGCQFQTVIEAKCLKVISLKGKLDDDHHEVAMQLKLELQKWCLCFCNWFEAQKGYVKALSEWLLRCLQYEPKETDDGMQPAPERYGAPPLVLIIYQWSQAMNILQEKKVVKAMHELFTAINCLLEQHNAELQQRLIADKDTEKRMKILERKEQQMQKIMQAQVKRMTLLPREESEPLLPRETIHEIENTNATSLKLALEHTFKAMEELASSSTQVYKELHTCVQAAGKPTGDNQNAIDS